MMAVGLRMMMLKNGYVKLLILAEKLEKFYRVGKPQIGVPCSTYMPAPPYAPISYTTLHSISQQQ